MMSDDRQRSRKWRTMAVVQLCLGVLLLMQGMLLTMISGIGVWSLGVLLGPLFLGLSIQSKQMSRLYDQRRSEQP